MWTSEVMTNRLPGCLGRGVTPRYKSQLTIKEMGGERTKQTVLSQNCAKGSLVAPGEERRSRQPLASSTASKKWLLKSSSIIT